MELCWGRTQHDAAVVVEVAASQRLLRIRHRKAQAMDRGCDRRNRVDVGKEMAMGLGRMRGIGSRGLVRQHANARQTMGLAKVHGRMLGTGTKAQEKQLSSAAGSELAVLVRLRGIDPGFVVEELATLLGNSLDLVSGVLAKRFGIGLVSVVGELETRLSRSCDVVWEVRVTLHEAGTGIGLEVRKPVAGCTSRVGWEVLARRRAVGSGIRRAVRERVRVRASRVVRVVLAIQLVLRASSWRRVAVTLRADSTVSSSTWRATGCHGSRSTTSSSTSRETWS